MSWVKYAKSGDKVVCVGEDHSNPPGIELLEKITHPEIGKIYTIKKIMSGIIGGDIGVELEEMSNLMVRVKYYGAEFIAKNVLFKPELFRPLQSRPTDISVFTDMLKRVKIDA